MRVGYFTMPLHPPGADPGRTMADDLEQLVFLDQLGYEEAWVGEHITAEWENIPCPDLFIAQALGMTRRMKLGTGVSCLPNHNPLMLAQRIAQLDQMAQGRFLWGVGSGGFPGDLELFELDAKAGEHRTVTRAALDLILDLWNDPKPGIYEAPRWRFRVPEPQEDIALRLHLRPYQRPHPPIAVAGCHREVGHADPGRRARLHPDEHQLRAAARASRRTGSSVEAGARQGGRVADRATWRIARDVFIADTTAEARRQALAGPLARDWTGYFFPLVKKGRGLEVLKQDPEMPDSAVTLEYLADNIWLVGDPDEVVRRIRALRDGRRRLRHAPRHRPRVGAARGVDAVHAAPRRRGAPAPVSPASRRAARPTRGAARLPVSAGHPRPGASCHDDPPARRRRDVRRRDRHPGARRRPRRLRAQPRPDGRLARGHAGPPPRPREDPQVPGRRAPPDRPRAPSGPAARR